MNSIAAENLGWKVQSTVNILRDVRESYARVVMSSSFGEYSAVMLHVVTQLIPEIPVIHVQLGDETSSTKRHREQLTRDLDLNVHLYKESGNRDKKDAFNHALRDVAAGTLLSGLMWDETRHRTDFDYVMYDEDMGIHRVHPILHWKQRDLTMYLKNNSLPINADYYDPHKEESEKKECGIHVFDYQQDGSGI